MEKILVIIPTYNEKENIEGIITSVFRNCKDHPLSILVVDDNSPDGTSEIVENMMEKFSYLFLIKRKKKEGLGKAYVAGFNWGLDRDYSYFCQMDADFSHNPVYLPEMLKLLSSYDFIIASRYISNGGVEGWGIIRKVISKGGSLYARIVLGKNVKDFTGGYNLWKREVLESIDLNSIFSSGYSFQIEMKYRAICNGFKYVEYPILFLDRKEGKSKMSKSIVLEAAINVLKLRLFQHGSDKIQKNRI
ncbi:MAG: polyprenol monophosphomannose synthase [Spirochaetes bacterium]|nr:polyprenol monophosphomannose synthase [Spirochaetota bacterium]MBP8991942.1 polyprenol monophosphomannose synthase [Spirochaetota bacterium]HOV46710.1 polyprenol monophosphomannose synthase [Exilispira sp.]HQM89025.1 polyprenol monophosphomannose synthase [Exilispira sp.]HQQ19273.1 polyprenol monophosphomannose synthase [Exilispira sp.]